VLAACAVTCPLVLPERLLDRRDQRWPILLQLREHVLPGGAAISGGIVFALVCFYQWRSRCSNVQERGRGIETERCEGFVDSHLDGGHVKGRGGVAVLWPAAVIELGPEPVEEPALRIGFYGGPLASSLGVAEGAGPLLRDAPR